MKIQWGRVFICCLIIFSIPLAALADAFTDVSSKTSKNYGAIEYLHSKGVISGYDDGTFKPDQTINRAEALKMVILAAMDEAGSDEDIDFSDVSSGDWFYPYVQKGVEEGLVEGYTDGSFKPGNNINIAESLKIVLLAFGEEVGNPPTSNPYPDVDVLAWYAVYADYAKNKQFIESMDDGKLRADRDITRGEFAELIYRLLYTHDYELEVFPLSTDWPTYSDAAEGYSVKYPYGWEIIGAGDQTIFWQRDDANQQLSWMRIFPNSATVVIAVDDNEEGRSLKEYTDLLEYDSSAVQKGDSLNGYDFTEISLADAGITDYYFMLPNGKILVAYAQVGSGDNQPLLREQIRYLIGSMRHDNGEDSRPLIDLSREGFLENVRKNVLVADQGQAILDMFEDEILIETDSIGIGTGPVDYYYSEEYDVTIKLERNSNVVLAINDGNSTAF
jgi:hypothetical protein